MLQKLGPQILPHPPYSLDFSQTDYHFFKHLNNFLKGKCFHNQQETEIAFQEFIKPEAWIFILHYWANLFLIGKYVLIVMVSYFD